MKTLMGRVARTIRCQYRHAELKIARRLGNNCYDHVRFRQTTGYRLHYRHPQTLNEKLMWLNRYWQPQLKADCTDKYKVRQYVEEKGLKSLLIPLLGVYYNADEIDFDTLPEQFVLKCNHGCGYNLFCRDKKVFDIKQARAQLNAWLKKDYSKVAGERHYTYIQPCIVCEQLISEQPPMEYQFWCVNGRPDSCLVCRKNMDGTYDSWSYSLDWKRLYERTEENKENLETPPAHYDEMQRYAEVLSAPFPFVRVDFYEVNNKVYLAELTFTGGGILLMHYKDNFHKRLGDSLQLPYIK